MTTTKTKNKPKNIYGLAQGLPKHKDLRQTFQKKKISSSNGFAGAKISGHFQCIYIAFHMGWATPLWLK